MTAFDTAKAVLAKASLYDQTFARPDMGIAVAWSEALGNVNREDALQSVTEHYAAQTRRMMVADVLDGVRRIRNERIRRAAEDIDYDPADVLGGIAAIRTGRSRVADGTVRERPVAALVQSTLQRLPKLGDPS